MSSCESVFGYILFVFWLHKSLVAKSLGNTTFFTDPLLALHTRQSVSIVYSLLVGECILLYVVSMLELNMHRFVLLMLNGLACDAVASAPNFSVSISPCSQVASMVVILGSAAPQDCALKDFYRRRIRRCPST